jgi:hypothetical protein
MPVKANQAAEEYLRGEENSLKYDAWLKLTEEEKEKSLEYLSIRMNSAREFGLGKVTKNHFVTDFHKGIYGELADMCRALCQDRYQEKTGMFTKVLPGPRGVAKTTCLRNFVTAAPLLAPKVVSYFFSVSSAGAVPEKVLSAGTLCKLVLDELFENPKEISLGEGAQDILVRNLVERSLRLVLVVDEVDQLFKAKESNVKFFDFAYKSLSELASLGNSTCGRLMIILSGSSSRLSTFIKGTKQDLTKDELEDFPILSMQLNMNNNRYKLLRVVLPKPDSIHNALAILHPSETLMRKSFEEEQKRKARAKMFVHGCNSRNLDDPVDSNGLLVLQHNHICRKLWTQLLFLWFGQTENRKLFVTLGEQSQTWKDKFWYGKWSVFRCQKCSTAKEKCKHAIEEYTWEGNFQPVTISGMYKSRGPELQYELETLQYEGHLLIIDDEIFPVSLRGFQKNLIAWAPSFKSLLQRRCTLLCTSPEDQLDMFDDLSAAAKDLVKEAMSGGIASL